jgi:CRISPR-associated protein Csb2
MSFHFCLSIRFLDPTFHGRGDDDQIEWPPSPLRAFQALVTAAARQHGGELETRSQSALKWLETQGPPDVIGPSVIEGSGYQLSVPNNAMDIVARAWSRGSETNSGDANPATHRTMKAVRPVLLRSGDAVHYIWQISDPPGDEIHGYIRVLSEIAGSVVALGWGIDMVVGHGRILSVEQSGALAGERWLPGAASASGGLRVPVDGTLGDLTHRHAGFLRRLGPGGFLAPPPLSAYDKIEYRRATDPAPRSVAAFSLLKLDASGFQAFDTTRQALTVAGMTRGAASAAAKRAGWSESKIQAFILGHGESDQAGEHVSVGPRRFAYVPLPSMEARDGGNSRVAGSIRRVMLTSFAEGCEQEFAWVRRTLAGQELIDERTKRPAALLSLIPESERGVRCYLRPASVWATVTPMVLPGYDDPRHYRRRMGTETGPQEQRELLGRLEARIDGLIRKAIAQAGFSRTLAEHAELDWRKVGFWPGADLAERYGVPDHLKRFPRLHVMIQWRDAQGNPIQIAGPICIGGGRFYGLGLFATV